MKFPGSQGFSFPDHRRWVLGVTSVFPYSWYWFCFPLVLLTKVYIVKIHISAFSHLYKDLSPTPLFFPARLSCGSGPSFLVPPSLSTERAALMVEPCAYVKVTTTTPTVTPSQECSERKASSREKRRPFCFVLFALYYCRKLTRYLP